MVANELEIASVAQLAVPCNDPVNPPVDTVDPVTMSPFSKSTLPLKYDEVNAVIAIEELIV